MDDLVHYDAVVLPVGHEYRVRNPARLAYYQMMTEEGDYKLTALEEWWRDRYDSFLSRGYQLRPRFRPGWRPSWLGTDLAPLACEDAYEHLEMKVIDAKRALDGKIVAIKQVPRSSNEIRIASMLSTPERLQDPMNHCVPIFDHFSDDLDDEIDFIVMPLLRPFREPSFSYVGEIIDFVRQTLEGISYIHEQNVAHRDLSDGNIMMDGRSLFEPDGFHPSRQQRTARNVTVYASPRTRSDSGPVTYFITDFGISTHFENGDTRRRVTGRTAQDKGVPELSLYRPYDPFLVDIYTLGMVYKRNFLDVYTNIAFLEPLVVKMTMVKPSDRPTARQALAQFEKIYEGIGGRTLRWHLCTADERGRSKLMRNLHSIFREVKFSTRALTRRVRTSIVVLLLFPVTATTIVVYTAPHSVLLHIRSLIRRR